MRTPTQAERQAVKAVDAFKGLDCGRFDPEKSDHIHGRRGPGPVLFDSMKGVKVFGCEACVFGERYVHTCGLFKPTLAHGWRFEWDPTPLGPGESRVIPPMKSGRVEASC
jgi:hypothetical protein